MSALTATPEMSKAALKGLGETEAARRYAAGEGNRLQTKSGRSYAAIVWQATFVPINLVLFVVSGALIVLGLPILAMVALFGALMALPLARRFYEIEPIKFADAVFHSRPDYLAGSPLQGARLEGEARPGKVGIVSTAHLHPTLGTWV